MKTFKTLLKTELLLSFRGLDMLLFAICMPVVVTIIIGLLFDGRPAYSGASYTFFEQSFGAICTIAICAGGVMGLPLVLSEYRGRKILKRFQVTPVSPALLLVVQVTIYAIYSIASLILVYLTGKLFFKYKLQGSALSFLGAYFLVMLSMFSIGILVGGIAPNSKIAGAIASLLYFPMLIFSGATLPYEIMPPFLQKFADLMPLTQGIKLLKTASLGLQSDNILAPFLIMLITAVACTAVSLRFFKWE